MSNVQKPKTYGVRFAWSLVLLFTVVSIALNGAHAAMQWDGNEGVALSAVLLAVMAPVALLLATHLVVGLIQDWSRRRAWLVWLRGIVVATVTTIGAVAFVMSFSALMDMAVRLGMPEGHAWMPPAIIDAMIVAATLAVVVAEAEMRLDREDEAVIVNDTVAVDGELPAANGHVVDTAIGGADSLVDSGLSGRQLAAIVDDSDVPLDVDVYGYCEVSAVDGGHRDIAETAIVNVVGVDDSDSMAADGSASEAVDSESSAADDGVDDAAIGDSMADIIPDIDSIDFDALAADVAVETNTKVATSDVAEALRRRADGQSFGAIARALGIGSHTTVSGMVRAAMRMDSAYAAVLGGVPTPQLAAVR